MSTQKSGTTAQESGTTITLSVTENQERTACFIIGLVRVRGRKDYIIVLASYINEVDEMLTVLAKHVAEYLAQFRCHVYSVITQITEKISAILQEFFPTKAVRRLEEHEIGIDHFLGALKNLLSGETVVTA